MRHLSIISILFFIICTGFKGEENYYLPFIGQHRLPIIQGEINGEQVYFLVDTGLDITLLNSRDNRKYGFKIKRMSDHTKRLTGFGGRSVEVKAVHLAQLELGPLLIENGLFACDISPIINSLQQKTGIKISGIIGSQLMKDYGFEIDYQNEWVRIKAIELPTI